MSDLYRHVWIGLDNKPHHLVADLERKKIEVDDDWLFSTNESPMHARGFVDPDTFISVAWRGRESDRAFLLNYEDDDEIAVARVKGNFPLAWDGGALCVQEDESGILHRYDRAGEPGGITPMPYAAEGVASIVRVIGNSIGIPMNAPVRFRKLPNGEFGHNIEKTFSARTSKPPRNPVSPLMLSALMPLQLRQRHWVFR